MTMKKTYNVMHFHIRVLKCLALWPSNYLTTFQNTILKYSVFSFCMLCCLPVIGAAVHQVYIGVEDADLLIESLIGVLDIIAYSAAYISFLQNQTNIQEIIDGIKIFEFYDGTEVIRRTEKINSKYTKYLLIYVTVAVFLNLSWPLITIERCFAQRAPKYKMHDPCGMTTRHYYPFDCSPLRFFLVAFFSEACFCYHLCSFFSLATATVIGFLMHITEQLKHCRSKFEHVFDNVQENEYSVAEIRNEFFFLVDYHQKIIKYAHEVFGVFDVVIVIYISITSITLAVTGYQIASPRASFQDKIRYAMLLFGWLLLFFLICFYAQRLQDESLKMGDSIYKSKWYENGISKKVHLDVVFVMLRSQRALAFKVKYLGTISLDRFVSATKTAYSVFTLLLTVTADE